MSALKFGAYANGPDSGAAQPVDSAAPLSSVQSNAPMATSPTAQSRLAKANATPSGVPLAMATPLARTRHGKRAIIDVVKGLCALVADGTQNTAGSTICSQTHTTGRFVIRPMARATRPPDGWNTQSSGLG